MGWISAGKVVRAVGLRGEVAVAGSDGLLAKVEAVGLRRGGEVEARRLLSARPQGRAWVVRLEAVESREEAEAICGAEVLVAREALGDAGEGLHYWADLEGLPVVTAGGEAVGTVTGLLATGAVDVLEVTGGRGVVLIPLAPYVAVDLLARRVTVDPPEGLLEAQETGRGTKGGPARGG